MKIKQFCIFDKMVKVTEESQQKMLSYSELKNTDIKGTLDNYWHHFGAF